MFGVFDLRFVASPSVRNRVQGQLINSKENALMRRPVKPDSASVFGRMYYPVINIFCRFSLIDCQKLFTSANS